MRDHFMRNLWRWKLGQEGAGDMKRGRITTKLGRVMQDDQARAALMIIEALEQSGWRIVRAAELLGYATNRTLDRYITQLGMRWMVRQGRRSLRGTGMGYHRTRGATGTIVARLLDQGDVATLRAVLVDAVRLHHGNIYRIAKVLGVAEPTVRGHTKRLAPRELQAARSRSGGSVRMVGRLRAWRLRKARA